MKSQWVAMTALAAALAIPVAGWLGKIPKVDQCFQLLGPGGCLAESYRERPPKTMQRDMRSMFGDACVDFFKIVLNKKKDTTLNFSTCG